MINDHFDSQPPCDMIARNFWLESFLRGGDNVQGHCCAKALFGSLVRYCAVPHGRHGRSGADRYWQYHRNCDRLIRRGGPEAEVTITNADTNVARVATSTASGD